MHPLSNAEYVIGKIWGNAVFIQLDLLIILLVVIFNSFGVAIDWMAYLGYFLLICIPTLIYIFGLSVSLMLILKSQAVTFVVLLGYIAPPSSTWVISFTTCSITWRLTCRL